MKHKIFTIIAISFFTIMYGKKETFQNVNLSHLDQEEITHQIINAIESNENNQNPMPTIDIADLDFLNTDSTKSTKTRATKPYTLLVYIAADNDLRSFASRNIQQMSEIGSNPNLNIAIHLDIRISANQKVTRRYFITEKNKIITTNTGDPKTQCMDSGDEQTILSAIEWAVENYPAENYMIIFWNHGSGIVDPIKRHIINPTSLFTFNPETHMFDLDRSIGFLELIEGPEKKHSQRGICWDDTTHNYLTNQKLRTVLETACTNILHKKFEFIGFDACLMSMIEVADNIAPYANFMVASEEVELGAGWNYKTSLMPFLASIPESKTFARHLVKTYEQTYTNITNDFTLSALDLSLIIELKDNINNIAQLLLQCIKEQQNNSVTKAIKISALPQNCTHFEEPSYVDLYDLYNNIDKNVSLFKIKNNTLIRQLQQTINQGKSIIQRIVIAYTTGKNLARARGISIYFPTYSIHPSYRETLFAKTTTWLTLLDACL